jgi:predicted methyltransferase
MIILSHYQAQEISARSKFGQKEIETSLDLGITPSAIKINGEKIIFPGGESAPVSELSKIIKDDKSCFYLNEGHFCKLAIFSEESNLYYKLFPTRTAPTLEISGIRMHRVKDMSPWEDAESKVRTLGEIRGGKLLDTCTGLGYTAIISSRKADEVYTFEKDSTVIEIEKINPWTKELFSSGKIRRENMSIIDGIGNFRNNFFDFIIHDPPSMLIAAELYSKEFYAVLFSKLKPGGKLYHYTGKPGSKFRHVDALSAVSRRLKETGFKKVKEDESTLGVLAEKN